MTPNVTLTFFNLALTPCTALHIIHVFTFGIQSGNHEKRFIYSDSNRLYLWNPIGKPRKTLFQSGTRAKNTAPAKRQVNCSGAAGSGKKR